MNKWLCFIVAAMVYASNVLAQDKIKRPDTYNYRSGIDAFYEEDYQKSMDFFDKELKQNPKNGYAMLWQAYIYKKYEKYGQAMSSVNQAVKLIPKKDKEWLGMGYGLRADVQAELGDTAKAIADYEMAFKTNPEPQHIFEKCNILHAQKKYDEIDAEIKRAMAIDENNAVTWVYAGRNEDAKGNYDAAIDKYNYAAKLDPNYSSAFSFRAATYMKVRKYREACQDAIAALSIDRNTKAFLQLFELADSAMEFLSPQLKAQQLKEPNESQWSYYLGLMQKSKGDFTQAEKAFKEALRISQFEGDTSTLLYQNLAETLNEIGKFNEAIDITDAAVRIDSTESRTWRDRAEIYYNLGQNMQAIDNASRAVNLAPDNDYLYYQRARIYMYNKLYRNALDDINTAITLDPEHSVYLGQRGEIYQRMERNKEAVDDFKRIIDVETAKPSDEQELFSLSYAYARLGEKAKLYAIIDRAFPEPRDKGDEYNLACLYSLINDREEALEHLDKALQSGYCEFVHIRHDTDLDNIRDTDRFKVLVDTYQNKYSDGGADTGNDDADYIEEITEVPFTKEAGIYKVKCTINDLPLYFFFDTGAADVTISSVEAQFMLKNDYLKPADIKGKEYYTTASGDIAEGTVIVLRKVVFGGLELNNVKASVVHNQKAPLLLGQTVLGRLGKIEIDYNKNVLKVTSRKRK